eukprot:scaffold12943_cov24-Tisochrysis_lutea.AAC.2
MDGPVLHAASGEPVVRPSLTCLLGNLSSMHPAFWLAYSFLFFLSRLGPGLHTLPYCCDVTRICRIGSVNAANVPQLAAQVPECCYTSMAAQLTHTAILL